MADRAKVLVVANRTAESPELLEALRERAGHGPCEFTLLVPSTPHGLAWAANPGDSGNEEAEAHRQAFVDDEIPLRKELKSRGQLDRSVPWLR